MGGVLFKMIAVLLCFRLGLAAAVGKGRVVQQASVVRIAEDLSDDDEAVFETSCCCAVSERVATVQG